MTATQVEATHSPQMCSRISSHEVQGGGGGGRGGEGRGGEGRGRGWTFVNVLTCKQDDEISGVQLTDYYHQRFGS